MEIRVNVPNELADRARARGVSVEAYVEDLLAEKAAALSDQRQRLRTAEQVRAWLDSLAQLSDKIPALPKEISREWLYQDHD